ncbi:MAG: hypothetical protein AAGH76_06135 [Pseudomonadota bacterium]
MNTLSDIPDLRQLLLGLAAIGLTLSQAFPQSATAQTAPASSPSVADWQAYYEAVAFGISTTLTASHKKEIVGSPLKSVLTLKKANDPSYETWILEGTSAGCRMILQPIGGDSPFGRTSRVKLFDIQLCTLERAGKRARQIDTVRIDPHTSGGGFTVTASARGELVAFGSLIAVKTKETDRSDQTILQTEWPKLTSVHGLYSIQPSGVFLLKRIGSHSGSEQLQLVVVQASDVSRFGPGQVLATGSWIPESQRLNRADRHFGSHCSFPQTSKLVAPVVDEAGRIVRDLYQLTVNPPDWPQEPRRCMVGEYHPTSCRLIQCHKWEDHPDYAVTTPTYLTSDLVRAKRLFARMEQWTQDRHGIGVVQREERDRNSSLTRDYAGEASKRAVEDYLIDLWNRPAQR